MQAYVCARAEADRGHRESGRVSALAVAEKQRAQRSSKRALLAGGTLRAPANKPIARHHLAMQAHNVHRTPCPPHPPHTHTRVSVPAGRGSSVNRSRSCDACTHRPACTHVGNGATPLKMPRSNAWQCVALPCRNRSTRGMTGDHHTVQTGRWRGHSGSMPAHRLVRHARRALHDVHARHKQVRRHAWLPASQTTTATNNKPSGNNQPTTSHAARPPAWPSGGAMPTHTASPRATTSLPPTNQGGSDPPSLAVLCAHRRLPACPAASWRQAPARPSSAPTPPYALGAEAAAAGLVAAD